MQTSTPSASSTTNSSLLPSPTPSTPSTTTLPTMQTSTPSASSTTNSSPLPSPTPSTSSTTTLPTMQTSTSSHSCTICNIEFGSRFEVRIHMTTVHEPKKAKAPQPASSTTTSSPLPSHAPSTSSTTTFSPLPSSAPPPLLHHPLLPPAFPCPLHPHHQTWSPGLSC